MAGLIEAEKPTIELGPEWQTSMPISIVFIDYMASGNFIWYRSPPILLLICLKMFEAFDMLKERPF